MSERNEWCVYKSWRGSQWLARRWKWAPSLGWYFDVRRFDTWEQAHHYAYMRALLQVA